MTQTEQLVELQNGVATTTSLQVAETFGKNHRDVLSVIDDLKEGAAENFADLFNDSSYIHPQNKQTYRQVVMNRDGFTLLAMGFTGKKALQFKLRYIQAFNEMQKQLNQQSLPMTNDEKIAVIAQGNVDLRVEVDEVKESLSKLTDEFGLPNKSAGKLRNYGNQRVTWWLGGKNTNAYQEISSKVFAEFWHDFKMYFGGLSSYKDLPMKDIAQAEAYIQNWHPSTNTQAKISELNSQTELEV
ncbi:phage regulatory protein [Weissella hellenica]|nr:phage regulatory protein [Weissella hellenica]